MDYTENYKLKMPAPEDYYNIADFNENAETIDGKLILGENAMTLANQLLDRVKLLENNYSLLAKKACMLVTVYAPAGCKVCLSSGSSSYSATLTSDMEVTMTAENVGEVQAQFTYNNETYIKKIQMLNVGHRYMAAPIPLESAPWSYIAKVSEVGLAQTCWQVGDTKTLNVNGNDVSVCIMGFEHDSLYTPAEPPLITARQDFTKAGITFGLIDLLPTKYQIHNTYSEAVKWSTCDLRLKTLPALLETMDSELQAAIKTVRKITQLPHANSQNSDAGGAADGLAEITADKLFIFSEIDLFGAARCSSSFLKYEEEAYAYYQQGGVAVRADSFWLRANKYNSSSAGKQTLVLTADNTVLTEDNDTTYGLVFGFCV